MANSSQPYSCSIGQTGGECKHPECSLRCSKGFRTLLPPCPESWWQLPQHCEQVWCTLPLHYWGFCPLYCLARACSARCLTVFWVHLQPWEQQEKCHFTDIFPLTPFHFLGSSLCFQTHMCWSNLQSCRGITLPLSPLVHRFLLPWSSYSCCCLAS